MTLSPNNSTELAASSTADVLNASTVPEIIDGGMGHMLRRLGVEISGPIGSQRRFLGVVLANTEQPEIVVAAHMAFLNAGAQVIITNNYAAVPNTLALSDGKYKDEDLETLVTASALRAREAVEQHDASCPGSKKRIAGSLPPLTESYRHEQVPQDTSNLEVCYRRIATALNPHVDILLAETMSCVRESVAAVKAMVAVAPEKTIWVSYTLYEGTNGTLRSGETVEDAVAALQNDGLLEYVSAVLFNCSQVDSVTTALPRLRAVVPPSVQTGAYANGFVTALSDGSGSDYAVDLTPAVYADIVEGWIAGGNALVGGCCGIFPEHIAELSARFAKKNETSDGPFTVYYHGAGVGFHGRILCVRAILEHAGAKYTVMNSATDYEGPPTFAPPMIKTPSGVCISQSTAIMSLLGQELGLMPEDPAIAARALQMSCDAADLMSDISNFVSKPERLTKWMRHVEGLIAEAAPLHYGHFQMWQTLMFLTAKTPIPEDFPKTLSWKAEMDELKGCKAVMALKIPLMP